MFRSLKHNTHPSPPTSTPFTPPASAYTGYMSNPTLSPFAPSPSISYSALPSDIDQSSSSEAGYRQSDPSFSPLTNLDDFPEMVEIGRDAQGKAMPELDFNEYLNFEFDSGNESHSPATASPTRTPPPFLQPLGQNIDIAPHGMNVDFNMPMFGADLDYLNDKPNAVAGPSVPAARVDDVVVKQEPVEFGWGQFDMGVQESAPVRQPVAMTNLLGVSNTASQPPMSFGSTNQNMSTSSLPVPPTQQTSAPQASAPFDFTSLPLDQQMALQQLMLNMMSYQANIGFGNDAAATTGSATVDPSQIFAPVSAAVANTDATQIQPTFATDTSLPFSAPVATPALPSVEAAPMTQTQLAAGPSRAANSAVDDDDELVSIDADATSPIARHRSMSTFSSASGLDERLDKLAPLSSIFSGGRGKGGKKGGGMSSVVRGEDEDLDDDDSWRPSAEEYKKLNSKEKRQLRNKLSARAFRNRRKDYIGTLEGHIRERDTVIDEMRSELQGAKSENQDLRRELEALKKSTMSIIHPATAATAHPSQVPSVISALAMPTRVGTPTSGTMPLSNAPRRMNTNSAPTPQFNPRKDLPANGRGRGAGGEGIFGGPPTICHTILTPDVLPGAGARQNMNPLLSAPSSRGSTSTSSYASPSSSGSSPYSTASSFTAPSIYSTASSSSHSTHAALNLQQPVPGDNIAGNTFEQWTDGNPFSFRSMDAYRMQMWSRLAREAQADKAGLVGDMRPKFFTEAHTANVKAREEEARVAQVASKLAQTFIGAFSEHAAGKEGTVGGGDKMTAVVTGRAHLRTVQNAAASKADSTNIKLEMMDVERPGKGNKTDRAERDADLIQALSGLKLQSGPGLQLHGNAGGLGMGIGARNDPLGVIGGFLRQAAHPTRA